MANVARIAGTITDRTRWQLSGRPTADIATSSERMAARDGASDGVWNDAGCRTPPSNRCLITHRQTARLRISAPACHPQARRLRRPATRLHDAASDFLPIVKEKSEAGRQPRRGARVREATLSPHPIAYCACGRAGLRQARAAFGGRFARLDSGHPTEAWLRIGFRDEWGLTVFPKSGTGRRRVQQMWMSSDPPLSSLTEVRIEHRLSL